MAHAQQHVEQWEYDAIAAMNRLRELLRNGPQSENMTRRVNDLLLDARLHIALQTGHYEEWGL